MGKGKKKRIKSRDKKGTIKKPSEEGLRTKEIDYPIFCFKHLVTTCKGDHKFYSNFIERLKKISNLTWKEIGVSHRHSFGTEKIPVDIIKPDLPKFISPDVTHLTVFRANGDKRPFLGIRNEHVFHIVFLEEKFGDIYKH